MNNFIYYYTFFSILVFPTSLFSQFTYSWSLQFGGGSSDIGRKIVTDSNGYIYVLGEFAGLVDFGEEGNSNILESAGSWDVFLAKYDPIGQLVFVFNIEGQGDATGSSIIFDQHGNIVICGTFEGSADFDPGPESKMLLSNGSYDVFIVKYTQQGDLIDAVSLGSEEYDHAQQLHAEASGAIYVGGVFFGPMDISLDSNNLIISVENPDWGGAFLIKYDSSFQLIYGHSFSSENGEIYINQIISDTYGNVYLAGEFYGGIDFDPSSEIELSNSEEGSNAFLAKYDTDGNFIYCRSIGDQSNIAATSLLLDNNQSIFIAGNFSGSVDFDVGSNAYVMTASALIAPFIAKYSESGLFIDAIALDGSDEALGFINCMEMDSESNLYISGYFAGELDFKGNDSNPTVFVSVNTSWDLFLAKYNAGLVYIDGFSLGGMDDDGANSLQYDPQGNIFITGRFNDQCDFDPGPGQSILSSNGYDDIFLAKYNQEIVNNASPFLPKRMELQISPNPASERVHFKSDMQWKTAEWRLLDPTGKVVLTGITSQRNCIEVDVSALPSGVYIVEISDGASLYFGKVVVAR